MVHIKNSFKKKKKRRRDKIYAQKILDQNVKKI